ncbi:MAG TPA: hypothetical protein VHN37_14815 [Actinomycetota bacterium]|nr:hypothetical protein [Actinomycetota bacterium]
MSREDGFTIVELSFACLLLLLVTGAGVTAIRHYWKVRSVEAAQDALVADMKQVQARTMSESHPRLYGLRLSPGSTPAAGTYGVVRFDYGTQTCTEIERHTFDGGAYVSAASFAVLNPGPTERCRAQIAGAGTDQFVFLFARGSATAGSATVATAGVSKTRGVTIDGITGRVARS